MGQPGSSVIAFLRHNLQSSVSGISSDLCVRGTRPSQSARRVGAPTPVVALAIKRPGHPPRPTRLTPLSHRNYTSAHAFPRARMYVLSLAHFDYFVGVRDGKPAGPRSEQLRHGSLPDLLLSDRTKGVRTRCSFASLIRIRNCRGNVPPGREGRSGLRDGTLGNRQKFLEMGRARFKNPRRRMARGRFSRFPEASDAQGKRIYRCRFGSL